MKASEVTSEWSEGPHWSSSVMTSMMVTSVVNARWPRLASRGGLGGGGVLGTTGPLSASRAHVHTHHTLPPRPRSFPARGGAVQALQDLGRLACMLILPFRGRPDGMDPAAPFVPPPNHLAAFRAAGGVPPLVAMLALWPRYKATMPLPPNMGENQIWPAYVWNLGRLADGLARIGEEGDPALLAEMRDLGVIPAMFSFAKDPDVGPTLSRCAAGS